MEIAFTKIGELVKKTHKRWTAWTVSVIVTTGINHMYVFMYMSAYFYLVNSRKVTRLVFYTAFCNVTKGKVGKKGLAGLVFGINILWQRCHKLTYIHIYIANYIAGFYFHTITYAETTRIYWFGLLLCVFSVIINVGQNAKYWDQWWGVNLSWEDCDNRLWK